jgi:hypothetical protein
VWLVKAAFVLAFEHFVILTQGFIQYMIPDVPEKVELHIQRARYAERQMQQAAAKSKKTQSSPEQV